MLSKNKIKYIQSLSLKKNRDLEQVFVAEGDKLIQDCLGHFNLKLLVATSSWLSSHGKVEAEELIEISSRDELKSVSALKSLPEVIAVFEQPRLQFNPMVVKEELVLALDGVQDPGNLGTIIRVADWFGIRHILCSRSCADVYNSKSVQATMGALSRVWVHYFDDLVSVLREVGTLAPVYGTFLDGESLYRGTLSPNGVVVMGNEGQGISASVEAVVSKRLLIPNYPSGELTSESLNVAMATGIIVSEFRRRIL